MNEHADPRAFTYAVGASLALHALLLALRAPEPQAPIVPSVTITAHLAEPEAPPAPAAAEPKVEPKAEPKIEKPRPRPKVERPQPAPERPSAFSVAPAPVEAPVETAEPAPAAPVQTIPGPVASAPPAPPAPDINNLIAQYRQQFIGTAVRYKRYPLAARDNGWEGDVVVHLEIAASGELAELKVKKSSGHAPLDQQALEMFRLASPQVPLPPALRGRAFGFDVRAVYSLRD